MAGLGTAAAVLPLIGVLALPRASWLIPALLQPYVTGATALVAALAFSILWGQDKARRPAGLLWMTDFLLGAALLRLLDASRGAASLLVALGIIAALTVPSSKHPARYQRLLTFLTVLCVGGGLSLLRAWPGAELALSALAAATMLAWHREGRQPSMTRAYLRTAAGLALVGQLAVAVQATGDGVLALCGSLYEFAAVIVLYRLVLQQTLRQPLLRLGELANALQAVASPILVSGVDGRIRWVNAAMCRVTGYPAEELLGQPTRVLEAVGARPSYDALDRAMQSAQPWRGQLPVRRNDGGCYIDDRRSTPVHDDQGALKGHVWVGDDLTERARAEERGRHSEESLRRLVDSAPDAIIVTDEIGRILRANPRVNELLGYSPDELEGMTLGQLMPPAMASLHGGYMQGYGHGRRGMTAAGREVQALRKDGSLVSVHVRVGEMPDLGGRRFVGFLRDMTEHKRSEAALRHGEEKLRKLYDMSPLGIALTDINGNFLDFNNSFMELTGYDAQSLHALSYWDLTPSEHESDERRNLELLQSVGRYGPYEKEYKCRDGGLRPVRLNGVRIEFNGQPCIWSIVEDLTDRRNAEHEQARLQRQLMQAQKMEALGQLTGGIAHDFNNMLAGILGLSTLALERRIDDPSGKVMTYLREIARVSERGRDLIERLMRFSRPAPAQAPQSRTLRPVVEEVLRMLASTLPPTAKISLHVEPTLPDAYFTEVDLHQALTNLVINARDAVGGVGEIDIELARVALADFECTSCGQRVHGPHVALRVRDNGAGIPPALMARVFDPFFTTKEVGKGTGLGLAMVHSLVHQAGGHVGVSSTPGIGTCFSMLLRPAESALRRAVSEEEAATPPIEPFPSRGASKPGLADAVGGTAPSAPARMAGDRTDDAPCP
ncbi:hypothetical protein GCM10009107_55610 [Ideonella azotifigens]|uniref:histidine kinase n=2 Tax=Ideonella azotifigens TaxID=513160 RepID=A0ABP3VUY3_9BURK